ncbi:MAG: 4Fe-4S binding protein [Alistipes indistinctus]
MQLARRFGEKVRDKLAGYEPGRFVRLEVARIPRPELSWLDKLRFVWYGLGLKVSKKPMPVAPVTDPGQCNGCGVCAIVCPTGAIAAGNELHTDASRCIRCCACVKSCRRTARSFDTPFAKSSPPAVHGPSSRMYCCELQVIDCQSMAVNEV